MKFQSIIKIRLKYILCTFDSIWSTFETMRIFENLMISKFIHLGYIVVEKNLLDQRKKQKNKFATNGKGDLSRMASCRVSSAASKWLTFFPSDISEDLHEKYNKTQTSTSKGHLWIECTQLVNLELKFCELDTCINLYYPNGWMNIRDGCYQNFNRYRYWIFRSNRYLITFSHSRFILILNNMNMNYDCTSLSIHHK